jgi:hypothetical protein
MRAAVKLILPLACLWCRRQESIIMRRGVPLSIDQGKIAKLLGITHPDRVRLLAVEQVPPMAGILRSAGQGMGLISSRTIGMALRYGIFIRTDCWGDRRLLVHELAHVAQYERLGGFRGFLGRYLEECIAPGYPNGELEQEAKRAESSYG